VVDERWQGRYVGLGSEVRHAQRHSLAGVIIWVGAAHAAHKVGELSGEVGAESWVSAGAPRPRLPSPAAPWQATHCPCQIFAPASPGKETVIPEAQMVGRCIAATTEQAPQQGEQCGEAAHADRLALLVEEAAQVI
jgi:hypothetical protein